MYHIVTRALPSDPSKTILAHRRTVLSFEETDALPSRPVRQIFVTTHNGDVIEVGRTKRVFEVMTVWRGGRQYHTSPDVWLNQTVIRVGEPLQVAWHIPVIQFATPPIVTLLEVGICRPL